MFPIEPSVLGGFVVASVAIVTSPGPDTVLVLRYALNGGRGLGLAAVSGVQLGLVVHTSLALLGISLLIASSPPLFHAVAVVGAAYLAWLGWQSLTGRGGLELAAQGPVAGAGKALREAALCNILNPKVILWYLALLPNFIDPARGVPVQVLALALVLIAINVAWQVPMALAAGSVRDWLGRADVRRAINRLSGATLIGMALVMLAQHFL
ncbi:MAG: LysE family translocator [Rhodospirillales bacterium]